MDSGKSSKISNSLSLFFGWIWLFGLIAAPALITWAIFGAGRWYYPLISLAIGGFCKYLCREYKKQAEDMFYESTGKDPEQS